MRKAPRKKTVYLADKLLDPTDTQRSEKFARESAWAHVGEREEGAISNFSDKYIRSLDNKFLSERVNFIRSMLKRHHYREIQEISLGEDLETINMDEEKELPAFHAKRRFFVQYGSTIVAVQLGERPLCDGMNIAGAHIDSPVIVGRIKKLDQDFNLTTVLCGLRGGIDPKDYFNRPMDMYFHGTGKDKKGPFVVDFALGRKEKDPKAFIAEQSFHLGQGKEPDINDLEAIVGTRPFNDLGFDPLQSIKLNILSMLYQKHGLKEKDLINADISFAPSEKPAIIGMDRSLVSAYGQDNWACAFPLLMGFLDAKSPPFAKVAVFYDREEVGDSGKGGLNTNWLTEHLIPALSRIVKSNGSTDVKLMRNAWSIFSDVVEPIHKYDSSSQDRNDSAYSGSGVIITPSSGNEWDVGAYSSSPEFRAAIMGLMDERHIKYQHAIMGNPNEKVTSNSAAFHMPLASGIDMGVPCIGCHRANELVSIVDTWMMYKTFRAIFSVTDHEKYMPRPRK